MNDIKNLNNKTIEYRYSLNISDDITFGVEIEYENILKSIVDEKIYKIKYDYKNYGNWKNDFEPTIQIKNKNNEVINGEIKSPILTDTKQDWINLQKTLETLRINNGIITNKCGTHINIGAHILKGSVQNFRNFFLLWNLYEEEIYRFSSGEFNFVRKSEYIKPIKEHLLLEKILSDSKGVFPYVLGLGDFLFDHKHDVSLDKFISYSFKRDNVIEFRLPNGTLNEEIIQNYINFFIKFLIACKKELDIEKIVYKINNKEHNVVELADYVFDDDIDKNYFLIQTLKTNKVYKKELPQHIKYY